MARIRYPKLVPNSSLAGFHFGFERIVWQCGFYLHHVDFHAVELLGVNDSGIMVGHDRLAEE